MCIKFLNSKNKKNHKCPDESESISHSVMSDSETLWTVACQAPLSMGFSRQEYWSGLPFPPPGDLPNPGVKPMSPALQANSLPYESPGKPPLNFKRQKNITNVLMTRYQFANAKSTNPLIQQHRGHDIEIKSLEISHLALNYYSNQ